MQTEGFVIKIWGPPREHGPPHVHVLLGAEGLIIVRLGSGGGSPQVWKYYNVRERDVVRAYRVVVEHEEYLLMKWETIHGAAESE